ncbi:MAG: MFS transporter [Holosporales bacterium]|jgi:predicted MFS family arabinose efflux permease|nr:MFS transporter [Holosporales bacterium]
MVPEERPSIAALISVVFFSTVATMMVTAVLPAYFKELGLSYIQIGRIEGCTACVAFLSKFLSGIFSDKIQKRKLLIVWGTGLSVIAKGSFALATGGASIFLVQICDRLAKGMRSCPLDAMISDLGGNKRRSYGVKHVVFLCGSITGSYITYRILKNSEITIKSIFYAAMIPAAIACLCAKRFVKEPELFVEGSNFSLKNIVRDIDSYLWRLFGVLFLLMFARFGLSFLVLKSMNAGIAVSGTARLYILYDISAAIAALFSVIAAKRTSHELLFKVSLVCHMIAHLAFFVARGKCLIFVGTILAGAHIGMSQGCIMYMISSLTKSHNRATAFSIYYLISSVGLFLSNNVAGRLSHVNPSLAFLFGAMFCALTLLAFKYISASQKIADA